MTIRALIERPFRQYADFSGRSGRAEYWLLILVFILATEAAWIIGYGGMRLAGFEPHDNTARYQTFYEHLHEPSESGSDLSKRLEKNDADHITFKLHRHDGEGLHLHGSIKTRKNHEHGHWKRGERHIEGDDTGFRFGHRGDGAITAEDGANSLEWIILLGLLVPLLATGTRRLHDSGKSGWWQMFVLIPVAGWLVLVIFFLLPGDSKKNRFGPAPG